MKRTLLGGAALVALGAIGLSATPAAAQLELTITGSVEPEFGFVSQDNDAGTRSYGSTTRLILRFNADGTADNGLQYGVRVRLDDNEAFRTATGPDTGSLYGNAALRTRGGLYIRELWGYARGGWGEVRAGEAPIAYEVLNYWIPTGSMPGNVGVLGSWDLYVNHPASAYDPNVGSSILTNTGNAHPSGVSYLLNDYNGFSFGITYAPTTQGFERTADLNELNAGFSDVVSVGANYSRTFSGITFGISAGGNFAHAEDNGLGVPRHDVREWMVGALISAPVGPGTFSLGGFYQNSGRGGMDEATVAAGNTNQAQHWGVGALYETGPWGFQVNYTQFNVDYVGSVDTPVVAGFGTRDVSENYAVGGGVSYRVAPGLTPYVNIVYFNEEGTDIFDPAIARVPDDSNSGVVGTVGVSFTF